MNVEYLFSYVFILPLAVDCGHCLPGWVHIDSKCFYLSEVTTAKRSWQDARNNCKRKGSDLAIVDTAAKQVGINVLCICVHVTIGSAHASVPLIVFWVCPYVD